MANLVCNYTITGGAKGGRLQGTGFPANNSTLNPNDTLQVIVTWTGQNAPSGLSGHLVFSPAPDAGNQVAPSPFKNGGNYVCYQTQTAVVTQGPGQNVTFTFPALTYSATGQGKYELTFVAQAGALTDPSARQWSADPEFDTSS